MAAALALGAAPASAAVFITAATGVDVVKVKAFGGDQVGNTVLGVADGTSDVVEFSSSTLLELTGSGYANISGVVQDGVNGKGEPKYKKTTFSDFNVSLQDPALGFTILEFNGMAKDNLYADLTATLVGGGTVSLPNVLFDNGENKYRVYATGGDIITNLSFLGFSTPEGDTPAGWDQFKQFDISTAPISAIPEPATWGMMILGFAGIGSMLRRSRRNGAPATA